MLRAAPMSPSSNTPAAADAWIGRNDAERALQRCDGLLQTLAAERAVNSGVLHVVILRIDADVLAPDAELILAERSYGVPRERWDAAYDGQGAAEPVRRREAEAFRADHSRRQLTVMRDESRRHAAASRYR